MKLLITLSTRPEIIRLSKIIPKLKEIHDVTIYYTNQNFDKDLSTIFFKEFGFWADITLDNHKKLSGIPFISYCMDELDKRIKAFDAVLFLGDTNGALATANVARRKNIPIFHMEAFNRCYDMKHTPEEINRRQIDAISDFHLCYTKYSYDNGIREGYHPSKLFIIGNPIAEILEEEIVDPHDKKYFYLATIHRKENMPTERLSNILIHLNKLDSKVKLIAHPTLMNNIQLCVADTLIKSLNNIEFIKPCNHKEFMKLQKECKCVISDSGSVQEEQYILGRRSVLLRLSTERPEIIEYNGVVHITEPCQIHDAIKTVLIGNNNRLINKDYHTNTSTNVIDILMKYKEV